MKNFLIPLLLSLFVTTGFVMYTVWAETSDTTVVDEKAEYESRMKEYMDRIADISSEPDGLALQSASQYGTMENLAYILFLMGSFGPEGQVGINYGEVPQKHTIIDMNGDGLNDMLFHYSTTVNNVYTYSVHINNGNGGFDVAYECNGNYRRHVCTAGTNTVSLKWRNNFPKSTLLNAEDDMYQVVSNLGKTTERYKNGGPSRYSLTDLNGDGLVDVVVHNTFFYNRGKHGNMEYRVLLNTGNLSFDESYRCFVRNSNNTNEYFGDCAG